MDLFKNRIARILPGIAKLALIALALVAFKAQAGLLTGRDVLGELHSYNVWIILASVALTAGSFCVLCGLELFALKEAGGVSTRSISRLRGAATGFVAHAFSQTLGFALITGAAVRVRAYSPARVSTGDIARVSAFVTLTATLGLVTGGATSLLIGAALFTFGGHLFHLHWLGWLLASLVLGYVFWCAVPGNRQLELRGVRMHRPSGSAAVTQILMATADWILAGSVLFVLLPRGMFSFPQFLPAFFVAQTVAVVSHVPGGLGVFEVILFALLGVAAGVPVVGASVAAAFLAYRVIYYLLPLAGAATIALVNDVRPAAR
ncbi:MAG: UPF0104 family protein [Gemmatimonadaceae bacterium]|nr:UPF0104 family protein [Gemmatimonadaceae bacterium]